MNNLFETIESYEWQVRTTHASTTEMWCRIVRDQPEYQALGKLSFEEIEERISWCFQQPPTMENGNLCESKYDIPLAVYLLAETDFFKVIGLSKKLSHDSPDRFLEIIIKRTIEFWYLTKLIVFLSRVELDELMESNCYKVFWFGEVDN